MTVHCVVIRLLARSQANGRNTHFNPIICKLCDVLNCLIHLNDRRRHTETRSGKCFRATWFGYLKVSRRIASRIRTNRSDARMDIADNGRKNYLLICHGEDIYSVPVIKRLLMFLDEGFIRTDEPEEKHSVRLQYPNENFPFRLKAPELEPFIHII